MTMGINLFVIVNFNVLTNCFFDQYKFIYA